MYCNAACKKRHRHKHKKECERRVSELYDEKLFKQPPPMEDCPICMIRLPTLATGCTYMACCGKMICIGCIHAPVYDHQGNEVDNEKCPFCRTPSPISYEEMIKRFEKRADLNDPRGICNLGSFYTQGLYGLPQNDVKALELYHRAGELGDADSLHNISAAYMNGSNGVEIDKKTSKHYYELAAIKGNAYSRHNLGSIEYRAGNIDRALKHFLIAVKGGTAKSLSNIKNIYSRGHATKDDYAKALRSYQAYLDEIKSNQRDEAAAALDHKYYESAV